MKVNDQFFPVEDIFCLRNTKTNTRVDSSAIGCTQRFYIHMASTLSMRIMLSPVLGVPACTLEARNRQHHGTHKGEKARAPSTAKAVARSRILSASRACRRRLSEAPWQNFSAQLTGLMVKTPSFLKLMLVLRQNATSSFVFWSMHWKYFILQVAFLHRRERTTDDPIGRQLSVNLAIPTLERSAVQSYRSRRAHFPL